MVRGGGGGWGIGFILALGDCLDVCDGIGGAVRSLGAFVVGSQSRPSLTQLGGHQHGVQVERSAGAALALLGPVGELNNAAVPIAEVLDLWAGRLVEQRGLAATWG